ncbi:MAG: aminotransferase class I/II-fold pyridoxal phosphate-dependent enzyme [Lachnospiraceae bacterium]|nr:aminotransferase class I/II-fold pyridoxal phosphate-dependent enzyme [Lachnospiraceae bacterium]
MSHGGDRYRNKVRLDFSVNTNPSGVFESVKQALSESIAKAEHYPDQEAQKLREELAKVLNVDPDWIIFGNGASEVLMAAVRAFQPKKVLLPVPSFSGYQWAVRAEGAEIVYLPMSEDHQVTEDLLESLYKDADLLILCNPNNPTGRYIDHDLLGKILDRCLEKGISVILDECFMELSDDPEGNSCIKGLETWPNMILLRAFTKSFAIPGVRLGYMVGMDTERNAKIRSQLPEWNLSIMAQEAGVAALKEIGRLQKSREEVFAERERLAQSLTEMGVTCMESNANFILVKSPVTDLYERLLEKEILIRDCSDYQGLEKGYYRIAVRPKEENDELIRQIREIINEEQK